MTSIQSHPDLSTQLRLEILSSLKQLELIGTKIYQKNHQKVYRFSVGSLDLIAKCYRVNSITQKFVALTGHSRARRSFRAGLILDKVSIPTPRVCLVIDRIQFSHTSSILVTEYCKGPNLQEYLSKSENPPSHLAGRIHQILISLRAIKFRHGDFHGLNIIVDEKLQPVLIDLDSTRKRWTKHAADRSSIKDRDRLLSCLIDYPNFYQTATFHLGELGSSLPLESKADITSQPKA